mgnify:CR=1 FL=1
MRRYAVTGRDGETHTVGVERAEDGRVHFTVGDEAYAYDVRRLPGQVVHLLTGRGGSYDAVIEWAGGEDRLSGEVAVGLKGQVYHFDVIDERKLRMRQAVGGGTEATAGNISAAMPGKVVRILVAPGDVVEAGQGMLVLEAMKMENELSATGSGTVKEILVSEGDNVDKGTLLIEVEASDEPS